jgi:hypothetical protein
MIELNDAAVLDQLREHWQKVAALIVWKLAPRGLTLTFKDIDSFPPGCVLFTHGHKDSIDFKIVTQAEAEQLAAHDARTNRGCA